MPSLILASASVYKRALLARLPVDFEAIDPAIDESPHPGEAPTALARRLAAAKTEALKPDHPKAAILGADQVIALGDRHFFKPGTPERAVDQLMALQGQTHHLTTAICLLTPEGQTHYAQVHFEMVMRPLSRAQAAAYVAEDNPVDCAGAYKIEAAGIRLFEATRGDDPTAIEGLPLIAVWTLLLNAGWTDARI